MHDVLASPLGKNSDYVTTYSPDLLFPIARQIKRDEIQLPSVCPFDGVDIWNAYEMSWLNMRGKPQVAILRLTIPAMSPNIVESKSLKLYFNSFNQHRFNDWQKVSETITHDLTTAIGHAVQVELLPLATFNQLAIVDLPGECLDTLDIEVSEYQPAPHLLQTTNAIVEEKWHSHLLKSNCLVTKQPDWGSVFIHYRGPRITPESLLAYIISFRCHNEFHEQCVERIFMDITRTCKPEGLTVYARYTRRGGLDINPFRSNMSHAVEDVRLARQ